MRAILVSSTGRCSSAIQFPLAAVLIARVTIIAMAFAVTTPILTLSATAQEATQSAAAARPLITQPVDESNLTTLTGNTHPLARAEFDLGKAPATLPMERMLLVLKRSQEQEAALGKLLDDQQNRTSANYHQWLTPEQFGKQFGPADQDMHTIASWLRSHGFRVGSTKGRTVLEFSGSASQVQEAFHTTIHKYLVSGEQYWANSSDPQIPTALTPAVAGVRSLNNFPRKPMNVPAGVGKRDPKTGKILPVKPLLTFPSGCLENNTVQGYCQNWVGPYDFATIYNVLPLWNAGTDGTGVTIGIVGETDIQMSDVQAFRSFFGLPVNDPVFVWNGTDPGVQGDESEADIDVQWSGAVAKGATIDFVISASTETTFGTDLSAVYIVENNLAAVMSESYGQCELALGTAGNQFYSTLWQQASAQGITVLISAGDAGSAGCDNFDAPSPAPAQYGLQISGYASTPYNVAVGGTDFNDFNDPATYWTTTNNPTTQESALGYIPETTWNDSCTNALWETFPQLSTNPETNCNNPNLNDVIIVSGSGGVSQCTTPSGSTPSSCSGGYSRPAWQTGSGSFSNDGKRDIPDVSLFASNGFVGSAYAVCQADNGGPCPSSVAGYGGTSVSSPAFAGIMALVNQQMGEREGNANYILYKLAAQQPTAFHDVTVGTNAVPCASGSTNCTTTIGGDAYGILSGYNAGAGYDLATGLGSVNANNLVTKWSSVTLLPSTTSLSGVTPTTITHGQAVTFTASVKPESGTGTPSGVISLEGGPTSVTGAIAGFSLSNGSVSGSTDMLPGGTYSVTAHYPGDATYGASDSTPVSVTVSKENSQPQAFLVTFDSNNRVINSNTNTAVYASPYILRVNVDNAAGQLCAPVATSGATACPTGSIVLTNNGTTLDAGTFPLNSYGYTEDLAVQLPGGTNSVKAAYAGDESFNASTATSAITITPAATTVLQPNALGAAVGQSASISTTVLPNSLTGVAPSGTVTFYANAAPLGGTVTYAAGGPGNPYLNATLTSNTNAFTASGNYAITAKYNGDANYSASTSPADDISILYPTPSVSVTPYSQTVNYGGTASITVLVDTANKTAYPTGTVTFIDPTGATVATPACTNAKDSSGNFGCQVVGTFTVVAGGSIQINYSGDANYPAASNQGYISMPDFQIFPVQGGVTVQAGQSQNLTINFNSINGFTGTVMNLACTGLPAEATCTFSPTQVALSATTTVSTTLTITTAAIGESRNHAALGGRRSWGMAEAALLLGACFIGIPLSRRRRSAAGLIVLASLFILPSCGGGGSGGGITPNPVPSISSLNPTQVAAGSQIQNLYVNGTNFLNSSTVTYNGTIHNSSLQSPTQIQIALGPSDVANTCQCAVVVTNPSPGGGPSAPVNFGVVSGTPTGVFNFTMSATVGAITHNANLNMTVQ